jgi:hypothetical protein
MRSKRKQKRKLQAQKHNVPPRPKRELPDPFSTLNPELVEDEVNREDMCPCCVDRLAQIELNKIEQEYLDWVISKEKR